MAGTTTTEKRALEVGDMPEARYHGTVGGYTNHRCRCARCREAMRASKLAYMDRSPEQREAHRLRLLARRGRPLAARTRAFAPRSDRGQGRAGEAPGD